MLRNIIRVCSFATFVLFTLFTVIEWGFQYKILAVVLLIFAVLGTVSLIRKSRDKKEYKLGRIIRNTILMTLLLCFATIPAIIFPQYEPLKVTGEHDVATATYTYVDKSRLETFTDTGEYRNVNVELWYPKDGDGTYPMVIFSHGSNGLKTSNSSTFIELASNGYVVCSIDHPYHSIFTKAEDGRTTMVSMDFMQEVIDVNNGVYNDKSIIDLSKKWMDLRVNDMNFVINTLINYAKDDAAEEVYKRIDMTKIGVFVHSLGGAAAIQIGRDRDDIGAVINLDADMLGEYIGIEKDKVIINEDIYTTPLLNIWSDTMVEAGKEAKAEDPDQVQPQEYIAKTALEEYDVYMKGTNHFSYTDLVLFSPYMVKMIMGSISVDADATSNKYYVLELMNGIILEFFDAYLKGEGDFTSEGTYNKK